jgi:hypothetical protein
MCLSCASILLAKVQLHALQHTILPSRWTLLLLLQICNDWASGHLLQSKAWALNTVIHTTLDWPMRRWALQ